MGSRGPVPKRSESRRRRNKPGEGELQVVRAAASDASGFVVPEADGQWHPIASRLWESARVSGQSQFYEPSDWMMLFSLCDDLSRYKQSKSRSAMMLASIMSGLSSLLLTEGDRRRVRVELARDADVSDEMSDGDAEVIAWKKALAKKRGSA